MENPAKYRNFIINDPILDFLTLNKKYKSDDLLKGFDEDLQLKNYTVSNKKIMCDLIFKRLGQDIIKIASDCFVIKSKHLKKHFTNGKDYEGDSYSLCSIEYSTISVLKNGSVSASHKYYNFKNWFYTIHSKFKIDNSFVIGRKYKHYDSFNYLAKMPYTFKELLQEADNHLKTLSTKTIGVDIFPNMKNTSDYPWHNAKKIIAQEIYELSSVKGISIKDRDRLISIGITGYDQIETKKHENFFHNFENLPLVEDNSELIFVDFEVLTSVYDDFSKFPVANDKEVIFNIGCVKFEEKDDKTFIIEDIKEEKQLMKDFVDYLNEQQNVTLVHWTNIEKRLFDKKVLEYSDYLNLTCQIKWFDLHEYFVTSKVYIEGCLNYKLKNVSRCLKSKDLIKSEWGVGGFCDGLGAMTGYIKHLNKKNQDILDKIAYYNNIDCRVMSEIYILLSKGNV
jgi:hypothetical protein